MIMIATDPILFLVAVLTTLLNDPNVQPWLLPLLMVGGIFLIGVLLVTPLGGFVLRRYLKNISTVLKELSDVITKTSEIVDSFDQAVEDDILSYEEIQKIAKELVELHKEILEVLDAIKK